MAHSVGLTKDSVQVGVVAQEVERVVPEIVNSNNGTDFKMVSYDRLTAVLIEAVKELHKIVKDLQANK